MRLFLLIFPLLIGSAVRADFVVKDQATFYGSTSENFSICWSLDETASDAQRIEMRRKRAEGGIEATVAFQRSKWVADGAGWCVQSPRLRKAGHYVYELRVCTSVCSPWSSSLTHGIVNGQSLGWWQYGYLAAPGSITPL